MFTSVMLVVILMHQDSIIVSSHGNCVTSTTPFTSRRVDQVALRNHVIASTHTGTLGRCAVVCHATALCRSFNFNNVTGDCELNNAKMDDFPADVQTDVNSRYIQPVFTQEEMLETICGENPCQNGGICKMGDCDSIDVISCDCPEGYSGYYCQDEETACADLGSPANTNYNISADGSTAKFECDSNYILSGSSTIWCNHGNWSEDPPSCRDVNSPATTILTTTLSVDGSFLPHQDINKAASTTITSFSINTDHYIAIGSLHSGCTIYKLENGHFSFYQEILLEHLYGIEFATIDSQHYIFFAVERHGLSFNANSRIYVWEDGLFIFHDTIATVGANDWHYFFHNGIHYLALASGQDGVNDYETSTSALYKWDVPTSSLIHIQNVDTKGCKRITSFLENSKRYIIFSNSKQNTVPPPTTDVFRVADDGNSLLLVDTLVAAFTYDSATYSYLGNLYLVTAVNYITNPIIYQWNGAIPDFTAISALLSQTYVADVCPFQLSGRQFLLFAGTYNPSTLLVDDGVSAFEDFEQLNVSGSSFPETLACHFMNAGDSNFIILAARDTSTPVRIYKWNPT
ncbi:thrombospondin-type laminin G domain and EAR repeat-containing protein-like [Ptychodera flava]|uniref:thrombospondin-type laminin G domain and EAR repeat-containing protein-like n=1 Tax=Ptychodera flava TaxID=63121 RepID=UPI00396A647C